VKDIFVARQPIFDARHNVTGYELLYRSGAAEDEAIPGELAAAGMSSSVIVDGVLGIGLHTLTDGHTAFINLSQDMILEGVPEVLDPTAVVIEILESVEPSDDIVSACRGLVEKGYTLALDDFVYRDALRPLLELADVVKVDVIESAGHLDGVVDQLRPFEVRLLAEKVENAEAHRHCVDLGFELFQGFHYFRPQTLTRKDLSMESVAIIRLLNLLQDTSTSDRAIEEAFRSDPSLTYKLLRIVNSAALGGRGVQSIGHGLRLLGRDPLYRWLSLLLMTVGAGGGEMRIEMIKASLLRGRLCELIGDHARSAISRDIPSGGALFLVGLFAHMDQILGVGLPEILADIDVTQDVRHALLERTGKAGAILSGVEAYIDAEWTTAERNLADAGIDPTALADLYLDSMMWAGARMAFHQEDAAA